MEITGQNKEKNKDNCNNMAKQNGGGIESNRRGFFDDMIRLSPRVT